MRQRAEGQGHTRKIEVSGQGEPWRMNLPLTSFGSVLCFGRFYFGNGKNSGGSRDVGSLHLLLCRLDDYGLDVSIIADIHRSIFMLFSIGSFAIHNSE